MSKAGNIFLPLTIVAMMIGLIHLSIVISVVAFIAAIIFGIAALITNHKHHNTITITIV